MRTFKQYISEVIARRGSDYVVMNKNRSKVLGVHDSKDKAQRQLTAIEISKERSMSEDWQKVNRKDKTDGLRKAFCSRMKGMKSKLTSAETSRDPDSRINKALGRWNCN